MAHAADALGVLTEDLQLEIFARVGDVLDLIRCAGTCTRWFRLISCPAFLRRVGLLHASFLVGAFWQIRHLLSAPAEPMPRKSEVPPQFYGLDTRPVGGGSLTFTSFIPNDDGHGLFNYAVPITARRGLLLVRIMPTPLDRRKIHMAVCHPLIGDRTTILVPPPPLELTLDDNRMGGIGGNTGYALFTAADKYYIRGDHLDHPQRLAFQVLVTAVHSDEFMYAYSYSSTTGTWSAPLKCSQDFRVKKCGSPIGLVNRSIAHWVYTDTLNFYTLSIRDDATDVSLTKIVPVQGRDFHSLLFSCISITGEGQLSFVNELDDGKIELWTRREQGHEHEGEWLRSELMSQEAMGFQILSFLERRGAMLVKKHDLFTLDLESKKMEPVLCGKDSWFYEEYTPYDERGSFVNHVLYEMDWSSYLLQLTAMNLG